MVSIALRLLRLSVAAALCLALVAIGYGHRTQGPDMTPELAAYVAAGGSLSDLCGPTDGDGPAPRADCEACRLSDTLTTLRDPCLAASRITPKTFVFGFVAKRLRQTSGPDPVRLTRAPPRA